MVKIYSNLQYNSPCNKTLSFCLCLSVDGKNFNIVIDFFFFFGVDDVQKRKKTKGK